MRRESAVGRNRRRGVGFWISIGYEVEDLLFSPPFQRECNRYMSIRHGKSLKTFPIIDRFGCLLLGVVSTHKIPNSISFCLFQTVSRNVSCSASNSPSPVFAHFPNIHYLDSFAQTDHLAPLVPFFFLPPSSTWVLRVYLSFCLRLGIDQASCAIVAYDNDHLSYPAS